jgi:hypothetical protein
VNSFEGILDFRALFWKGDAWTTKQIILNIARFKHEYDKMESLFHLRVEDFLEYIYSDGLDADVRLTAAFYLLEILEVNCHLVSNLNDSLAGFVTVMIGGMITLPFPVRYRMALVLFTCANEVTLKSLDQYKTSEFVAVSVSIVEMSEDRRLFFSFIAAWKAVLCCCGTDGKMRDETALMLLSELERNSDLIDMIGELEPDFLNELRLISKAVTRSDWTPIIGHI